MLPFSGLRTILTAFWHEISRDGYRPELHYMRGPGPAWHAKNGQVRPSKSPPSDPRLTPPL